MVDFTALVKDIQMKDSVFNDLPIKEFAGICIADNLDMFRRSGLIKMNFFAENAALSNADTGIFFSCAWIFSNKRFSSLADKDLIIFLRLFQPIGLL